MGFQYRLILIQNIMNFHSSLVLSYQNFTETPITTFELNSLVLKFSEFYFTLSINLYYSSTLVWY